jgi:hypothetical protein
MMSEPDGRGIVETAPKKFWIVICYAITVIGALAVVGSALATQLIKFVDNHPVGLTVDAGKASLFVMCIGLILQVGRIIQSTNMKQFQIEAIWFLAAILAIVACIMIFFAVVPDFFMRIQGGVLIDR